MNIPKVLGITPVAAFEFCFFIRKEFFKKKISRQIAFELISLFNVQIIQEPTNRSTTIKAFVFLAKYVESYHKMFETRSRSCWMNVAPVASL